MDSFVHGEFNMAYIQRVKFGLVNHMGSLLIVVVRSLALFVRLNCSDAIKIMFIFYLGLPHMHVVYK